MILCPQNSEFTFTDTMFQCYSSRQIQLKTLLPKQSSLALQFIFISMLHLGQVFWQEITHVAKELANQQLGNRQ